jgi:hypothetical protein
MEKKLPGTQFSIMFHSCCPPLSLAVLLSTSTLMSLDGMLPKQKGIVPRMPLFGTP